VALEPPSRCVEQHHTELSEHSQQQELSQGHDAQDQDHLGQHQATGLRISMRPSRKLTQWLSSTSQVWATRPVILTCVNSERHLPHQPP